ncbi:MAG: hypothetical protein AB9866_30710 [Syntrophobacteraceae bacterium]
MPNSLKNTDDNPKTTANRRTLARELTMNAPDTRINEKAISRKAADRILADSRGANTNKVKASKISSA